MPARPLPDKFLVAFSFAGEQRDLVRAIVEAVEKELGWGKVFFDEWFEPHLAGGDADVKLQKLYRQQCELAVVCVAQRYGEKAWTKVEHEAIRARKMELAESKAKGDEYRMLPVRVGEGEVEGILFNTIAPDVRTRTVAQAAELIIERLRLIIPDLQTTSTILTPAASWPGSRPQLDWPIADHNNACSAFETLLAAAAPRRFLPICGLSKAGKSHVTRLMRDNALAIPGLACGRFDFKGTTGMDAELSAFVQELGTPVPPSDPRLSVRLGRILEALKQRAHPTLLIFDTYEAAGEAQDWVEKQLLPGLIRATWLRVVVAGQSVPPSTGTTAFAPVQLVPPPPEDWFLFGRRHKPDITLEFVRQAHQCCGGNAYTLAQLLGPAT